MVEEISVDQTDDEVVGGGREGNVGDQDRLRDAGQQVFQQLPRSCVHTHLLRSCASEL